jgi:hypothetical protein
MQQQHNSANTETDSAGISYKHNNSITAERTENRHDETNQNFDAQTCDATHRPTNTQTQTQTQTHTTEHTAQEPTHRHVVAERALRACKKKFKLPHILLQSAVTRKAAKMKEKKRNSEKEKKKCQRKQGKRRKRKEKKKSVLLQSTLTK